MKIILSLLLNPYYAYIHRRLNCSVSVTPAQIWPLWNWSPWNRPFCEPRPCDGMRKMRAVWPTRGNFGAGLLNVEPLHRQGVEYLLQEVRTRLSLILFSLKRIHSLHNTFRTRGYFEKPKPISIVKREKGEHPFLGFLNLSMWEAISTFKSSGQRKCE